MVIRLSSNTFDYKLKSKIIKKYRNKRKVIKNSPLKFKCFFLFTGSPLNVVRYSN